MEKLLLLWDELDELGVYGHHFVSGVSGAVQRLSAQVGGLMTVAGTWLACRNPG